jgi:hypothetical protein
MYYSLANRKFNIELSPTTTLFRSQRVGDGSGDIPPSEVDALLAGDIPNYDHTTPKGRVVVRKITGGDDEFTVEVHGLPPSILCSFEVVTSMEPYTSKPLLTGMFNGVVIDNNGYGLRTLQTTLDRRSVMFLVNGHTIEGKIYPAVLGGIIPGGCID